MSGYEPYGYGPLERVSLDELMREAELERDAAQGEKRWHNDKTGVVWREWRKGVERVTAEYLNRLEDENKRLRAALEDAQEGLSRVHAGEIRPDHPGIPVALERISRALEGGA